VNGVEVIIGNCLPVYLAPLSRYSHLNFFQEDSSRKRGRSSRGRSVVGRQYNASKEVH